MEQICGFLMDRFGVNFTVYKDISTNQFLHLSAPSGSGYTVYYVNAGKIVNQGIEFTVDADVVRNGNFSGEPLSMVPPIKIRLWN